ncbi:MAG: DUF2845 domain-containing protein [Deltaproteobacteria bacterium]|nr:DUF2845 domain-containing protein [Candidatus Anaeroferrophillacea bacterium]
MRYKLEPKTFVRIVPFVIMIMLVTFLATAAPARAMRCGKDLVSAGDHKYEVLATCGDPVIREDIGIDHKQVGEYRIIEEWLYVIERYGKRQMYRLRFDGDGILRDIEWLGERK